MMITFVAGMPRAGSMWTYNVARAILETKFLVLPKTIPIDERTLIKNALISEEKKNEAYCIKTHYLLKNPLPTKHETKIICNIRDVRDACLSYMRFTHADYEKGIRAMIGMMKDTDYYQTVFRDNLLNVRFENLTADPLNVVEEISIFLKIDLSKGEKREIVRKFSKPNIQKKLRDMSKIKINMNGQVEGDDQKSRFDSLGNFDGTYRAYDKNTAFQSNHITSTKDGEWRTLFEQDKAGQLINLSKEWLLKYGYKI